MASATVVIKAPIQKIFRFVTDPALYPNADDKILKMRPIERGNVELRIRATGYVRSKLFRGSMNLRMRLDRFSRVEIESEPGSISFPGNFAIERFHAEFLFKPTTDGVEVTHSESYVFKENLIGRLARLLAERWLKGHLEEREMVRLKALLEGAPPA